MALALTQDTPRLRWEPMPGIPGFKHKVLRVDAVCGGTVELQYAPPGFGSLLELRGSDEPARRHYHRTVTERLYFLAGDLPNCDWRDLADESGTVTVYRRHMLLDRPPLTLHGLAAGHVPEAGSEYLVWNTGPGTSLWEPEAAVETVVVPARAGPEWDVGYTQPRILEVDRLPWAPHASVPDWKHKTLAAAVPHAPQVELVLVAPGPHAPLRGIVPGGASRWMFVLAGNLTLALHDGAVEERVQLHEGSFLDLPPGSAARVAAAAPSEGGATVLCVGHDLAVPLE